MQVTTQTLIMVHGPEGYMYKPKYIGDVPSGVLWYHCCASCKLKVNWPCSSSHVSGQKLIPFCSHYIQLIMTGRIIAPFIYFSIEYISDFEKVGGYQSHSYRTGYTAVKLLRNLLNTNLILNGQLVFWRYKNNFCHQTYTAMIQNASICM